MPGYIQAVISNPAGKVMDLGMRGIATGLAQAVSDMAFTEENIDMVYPDMLKQYVEVSTIKKAVDFAFLYEVNEYQ